MKHHDSPGQGSKVHLATFNLQNLALPDRTYYPGQFYTPRQYQEKIAWTGSQLARMNADVVGFQEVFHRLALEDAIGASKVYGGKTTLIMNNETGELPRVALLTRYPVLFQEDLVDFPPEATIGVEGMRLPFTSFHRPVIHAVLELPGGVPSHIFVVHLKSKRPLLEPGEDRHDPFHEALGQARSLILRACEVTALRYIILKLVQGTKEPVIFLGDFNDSTHAVTSDILQGRQPQRNYPLDVKRKLWDVLLYSCADIQARRSFKDVYYTHLHNSHYESLDHILVSQEFVNENPNHIATVEFMRLFNDHLLDPALTDERPSPCQSDHGQVLVQLKMRDHHGT